jgi:hypothetical protein
MINLSAEEETAIRDAVARQTWTVGDLTGSGFVVHDAWDRSQAVTIEQGPNGWALLTANDGQPAALGEPAADLLQAVADAHWKLLAHLD